MKFYLNILVTSLFIVSLCLVLSCSDDGKSACVKACDKYTKCNKKAAPDKGVASKDAKTGGKDAGAGGTFLPMVGGPGSGSCRYSPECSPKEQCFSSCITSAPCGALNGKDKSAIKAVNICLNECSKKKWDAGVKKDKGGCKPQCGTRKCGPNGCGGQCGQCPTGKKCGTSGQCVPGTCTPQCSGKQCGPNGCGGQCGKCPTGKFCNTSGKCVASCVPQCTGKVCGPNGCGGQCGNCPTNYSCNASGQCMPPCTPNCSGKECGDNGCGGSCGSCPTNEQCGVTGKCEAKCLPNCTGKVCGDNGCGGSCGSCKSYETCDTTGQCQQTSCGPITKVGCCDGQLLKYCQNGSFKTLDCAPNPSCGWDSYGSLYDCSTSGGSDPSGVNTKACP